MERAAMSDNEEVQNLRDIGFCGNWTPFGPCEMRVPGLVREKLKDSVPRTTADSRAEDRFTAQQEQSDE